MKKLILALCMAAMAVCASAQQGSMAVGVNLGVVPFIEGDGSPTNFEIGAKYQYGLTESVRLEADLDYAFKSDYIDVFTLSANVHYLVPIVDKVKLYPLAGLGYGRVGFSTGFDFEGGKFDLSTHSSRFLFNIGLGAQYDLTDNLVANFEFKYQYMKDFNRLPIMLGLAYKF